MRILQPGLPALFAHQPFSGGLGAALYIGYGDPDPGKDAIRYRHGRIPDGTDYLLADTDQKFPLGNANVTKTEAIAFVKSPTKQFVANLPSEALVDGMTIWFQVRTHQSNVENETIYRPRKIVIDSSFDGSGKIEGSGRLLKLEKRDAGGVRFRFVYSPSKDGLQPTQFVLNRTAGPTSPSPETVLFVKGKRQYEIDIAGLQDAGAYTFQITAENGAVSKLLVGNNGNDIDLTADADGPPPPDSLIAVEY